MLLSAEYKQFVKLKKQKLVKRKRAFQSLVRMFEYIQIHTDISYGDHPRNTIDIYIPKKEQINHHDLNVSAKNNHNNYQSNNNNNHNNTFADKIVLDRGISQNNVIDNNKYSQASNNRFKSNSNSFLTFSNNMYEQNGQVSTPENLCEKLEEHAINTNGNKILMDIAKNNNDSKNKMPVVVFVHGGAWATGDKWEMAAMGARLAESGIISCKINYTYYGDFKQNKEPVLIDDIVNDVSSAYRYICDNIHKYYGDNRQIVLVAHSAGAQLAFRSLLNMIQSNTDKKQNYQLPIAFVGLAGVYDIFKHYAFEKMRGLEHCSPMARVMGGFQYFAGNSPICIFQDYIARSQVVSVGSEHTQNIDNDKELKIFGQNGDIYHFVVNRKNVTNIGSYQEATQQQKSTCQNGYNSNHKKCAQNQGDNGNDKPENSIPERNYNHKYFFESNRKNLESTPKKIDYNLNQEIDPRCFFYENFDLRGQSVFNRVYKINPQLYKSTDEATVKLTPQMIERIPDITLMHGCEDTTVPWHESTEFHNLLIKSGVKSELMLCTKGGHLEYVLKWRQQKHQGIAKECVDLIQIIKSKVHSSRKLPKKYLISTPSTKLGFVKQI
eukprot:TRINITY_DN5341_c0_g1_i1.p1 TRINITY_DN5341_c0_g1~~TRINITY_DN5341_c0_g1_i1.p1  ORF type:complete len:607 (-),score=44.67 TRINITY_DN5341_c0_g1_i1:1030-2850(-)